MQYTKFINPGALKKTGISSILLFGLVVLPGAGNVTYRPIRDEAEHVQRAIQLANEREMMGSDSIRLTASVVRRKTGNVHDFVNQYIARSIRPEWKNQAPKVARAVLDASIRHGFDPLLLLALIQNESRFDP